MYGVSSELLLDLKIHGVAREVDLGKSAAGKKLNPPLKETSDGLGKLLRSNRICGVLGASSSYI